LSSDLRGAAVTFTAVYMPVPEGYIGFVEEIPGANSQGETLE
jgi:predicted RNase H-like HicB family nuclease